MNWLDVLVLFTLGLRTWVGYRRGLVGQIFSLAGLIVGLILAAQNYHILQSKIALYFPFPAPVLAVMAFFLILFIVMLVARLISSILTSLLHLPGLGWINSLSGALVGALVAAIVIAFSFSLLHIFSLPPVEAAFSSSIIVPYLEQVTPYFLDVMKEYIPERDQIAPKQTQEPLLERQQL